MASSSEPIQSPQSRHVVPILTDPEGSEIINSFARR